MINLLTCELALERLSPESFHKYQVLKERLFKVELPMAAVGMPGANCHGPGHIQRVLECLDKLLGPDPLAVLLSPYELWLTLLAVIYHDVGMLQQREDHPQLGAEEMLNEQNTYLFDRGDKDLIAIAICTHGSSAKIEKKIERFPSRMTVGRHEFQLKTVCALVRLADELEEDKRRGDPELMKHLHIEEKHPGSVFYWHFNQCVSGISVTPPGPSREVEVFFEVQPAFLQRTYLDKETQRPFIPWAIEKLVKFNLERIYCNQFLPESLRIEKVRLTLVPPRGEVGWTRPESLQLDDAVSVDKLLEKLPAALKQAGLAPSVAVPSLASSTAVPDLASGADSHAVYGRKNDVERLATKMSKPIVAVYGLMGIGKTWLIRELVKTAAHKHRTPIPIRISKATTAQMLYESLSSHLGDRDEAPQVPTTKADWNRLSGHATANGLIQLENAHLLFDTKGFVRADLRQFLSQLADYVPHIRVVLECREKPPAGWLSIDQCDEFHVMGIDQPSMMAYLQRTQDGKGQPGTAMTKQEQDAVYRRLGGRPDIPMMRSGAHPMAMYLLDTIARQKDESPSLVLRRYSAQMAEELQRQLFGTLFTEILTETEQHALGICALYRTTIPHRHAYALNNAVSDDQAFDKLVRRILLQPNDSHTEYSLHNLVAEQVLLQRSPTHGAAHLRSYHGLIADAWLADLPRGKPRISPPEIRATSEALHHLLESEQYGRLHEITASLVRGDFLERLDAQSDRLHAARRFAENRQLLELLVQLAPDDHKALRFLGESLARDNPRDDRVLQLFQRAHEVRPDYPHYLANLGTCLLKRDAPHRFLEVLAALSPTQHERAVDDHVSSILASCYEGMNRNADASALRMQHIERKSTNPVFYVDEARYLLEQNLLPEAEQILDKAQRASATNAYTESIKATLLERQGKAAEASALRRQHIERKSTNPAFYSGEARYLLEQNLLPEAEQILDKAQRAGATDAYTESIKATLLERQGKER